MVSTLVWRERLEEWAEAPAGVFNDALLRRRGILCLSFTKTCSIGFDQSYQGAKRTSRAPAARIIERHLLPCGAGIYLEDDDVAASFGFDETARRRSKTLTVDGPSITRRRVDPIAARGLRDEGHRLQWPSRAFATSLFAFRTQPHHAGHARLTQSLPREGRVAVDEDETGWIDAGLTRLPAFT